MSIHLTALRESPRRPGRYLLSLSDGRELVVGLAVLADAGVTRVGMEVAPALAERLQEEHGVTALVDRAMDALARGRRTRRELEIRLRRREATPAQIRAALDRLEAAGHLSDAAVAQAEAASRLRRGEAPARVRQRLQRKGVAGPLVADAVAVAQQDDGYDERAACTALATKRLRALATDDRVVARRKLLGFLLRRGFGGTIARSVVREVLGA